MGPTTRLWMQRFSTFKGLSALPGEAWKSLTRFWCKYNEAILGATMVIAIFCSCIGVVWYDSYNREPATAEEIISARKESWCMDDYLPKYAAGINGRFLRHSDIKEARGQCEKAVREYELRQQQERALGALK